MPSSDVIAEIERQLQRAAEAQERARQRVTERANREVVAVRVVLARVARIEKKVGNHEHKH